MRRNAAVQTTTNSIDASGAHSGGLAGRKFSKAKSVAERLGICSRTVLRWADSGKITRYKINARTVLFDEAEVAMLIDSARMVPVGKMLISRRVREFESGQEVAKQDCR